MWRPSSPKILSSSLSVVMTLPIRVRHLHAASRRRAFARCSLERTVADRHGGTCAAVVAHLIQARQKIIQSRRTAAIHPVSARTAANGFTPQYKSAGPALGAFRLPSSYEIRTPRPHRSVQDASHSWQPKRCRRRQVESAAASGIEAVDMGEQARTPPAYSLRRRFISAILCRVNRVKPDTPCLR